MLRYFTAGESHGPCLTMIIDGVPAGFPVADLSNQSRSLAPSAGLWPGRPDAHRKG